MPEFSFKLSKSKCLNCGHIVDTAAYTDNQSPAPNDGDICLCINCGAMMAYNLKGKLRGLTNVEIDNIITDTKLMNHIVRLVKVIHFVQAIKN